MDTDNPDHISWLYSIAAARAKEFNIEGVTWSLTQGVVKNIIPAIASTNAIIAASCCNEAFKIATTSAPYLDNYFMLIGTDGVYSYTFQHEKRPDCPVCGGESRDIDVSKEWTLEQFIESLAERQELYVFSYSPTWSSI
jgi:ubiquitin-activating enzyme E1 C